MKPILRAIELLGSQEAFALACGVKTQAVTRWKRDVPAERAPLIERVTRGEVRCEELCPHIEWIRDARGKVTGYVVRMNTAPARRAVTAEAKSAA